MKDKDLKRLSRAELLEMLIAQSKEVQRLQQELADVKAALASRSILINKAGSIAEASLQLSGIFSAAQQAADQYLENVTSVEIDCAALQKESREKAAAMIAEAQAKCEEMERKAQVNSLKWWTETSKKLEDFYLSHPGLREKLAEQHRPD